jgi:hypothetical protein
MFATYLDQIGTGYRYFPTKGFLSKRQNSPCNFQVVAFLSTKVSHIIGTTYTDTDCLRSIYGIYSWLFHTVDMHIILALHSFDNWLLEGIHLNWYFFSKLL